MLGIIGNVVSILFNYTLPKVDNLFVVLMFTLICNLINFLSFKIMYKKASYLFMFLLFGVVTILYFGFNQYVGFFFLVESTAVIFIIAIVFELKYIIKHSISKRYVYKLFLLFIIFIAMVGLFYFNKFSYDNYYQDTSYLNKMYQSNNAFAFYSILFNFTKMYIVYISVGFILVTIILILFYNNYRNVKTRFYKSILGEYVLERKRIKNIEMRAQKIHDKIASGEETMFSYLNNPKYWKTFKWK